MILKEQRSDQLKELLYPSSELTEKELKELSYSLIRLASGAKTPTQLSEIYGILRNHIRFCINVDCNCQSLQKKNNDMCALKPKKKDSFLEKTLCEQEISTSENKNKLEQGLYEVLNKTLSKFDGQDMAASVEILMSYLNHYRLGRTFTALYHLMLAEEYGLTIFQEFQIYCIRHSVELTILEEENKSASSAKMDFDKMVAFHRHYMKLLDLVLETTKDFQRFWAQFLQTKPELDNIVEIGFGISIKCESIEQNLENICIIDPNNLKGLLLFGLFQKYIMEDDFGAIELLLF